MSTSRNKINKLIFSAVLTAVISLPLMIPGCTPLSPSVETGNPNAAVNQSTIQPFIDMANIEAASKGQTITLDNIMNVVKESSGLFDTGTSIPTFTQYDDHIDAIFDNGDLCTITIKDTTAKIAC